MKYFRQSKHIPENSASVPWFDFVLSVDMKAPCAGKVVALRGYDGKLLWKVDVYSEVFAINCHGIDVNKDGTKDCLASGRLGTLVAINPKNGMNTSNR